MDLREQIARLTDDYFAASDRAKHYDYELADRILAIPEIADALRLKTVKPLDLRHSISREIIMVEGALYQFRDGQWEPIVEDGFAEPPNAG